MTCQFTQKGMSVEDCINLCNSETDNLCSSFCEDKCRNCQDPMKCPWLLNTTTPSPTNRTTTTSSPIYSGSRTEFNAFVDRLQEYARTSDMLIDSGNNLSETLPQLNQINDDKMKRDIIITYLMGMYDINTNILADNYEMAKRGENSITRKKNIINNNKKAIKELLESLKVKEREYKMNLGRFERLNYDTELMKHLLWFCIAMFIVPLLYLANLLPKIFAVIVWLLLLGIFIGFTLYKRHNNNLGRDSIFYGQYNFDKPTNENILKSRLKQQLDPKCKADLDTAEDDFDPSKIDIGDVSAWKNKTPNNI